MAVFCSWWQKINSCWHLIVGYNRLANILQRLPQLSSKKKRIVRDTSNNTCFHDYTMKQKTAHLFWPSGFKILRFHSEKKSIFKFPWNFIANGLTYFCLNFWYVFWRFRLFAFPYAFWTKHGIVYFWNKSYFHYWKKFVLNYIKWW